MLWYVCCLNRKPPPRQQPPQHRLNLTGASGGGGPPRRKLSGYTRPQFAGPMELETLMEEGASSPGPGRRGADDQPTAADGDTRAPLTNGDKSCAAQQLHNQHKQRPDDVAAMKMNTEVSRSSLNLYLAACTGQFNIILLYHTDTLPRYTNTPASVQ